MNCELTSCGVKVAPITKAPTMTYGRISRSLATDTMPTFPNRTTATGPSKVTPNARSKRRPKQIFAPS